MKKTQERRGVVIVLSAILMVVMFAMAALAIDMGYMFVVRTQLQAAADSGALAAGNSMHLTAGEIRQVATDYATRHDAGGRLIKDAEVLVELGVWDADAENFEALSGSLVGNAVRVTTRRSDEGLFFARVMGMNKFATETSAIAMANPKDIVFVIDTSGSMNDDTEPAWATSTINTTFAGGGFGKIGNDLVQDLFDDLGFGTFPGKTEYLGSSLSAVGRGSMAYAKMTSDVGPLSKSGVASQYRIVAGDDEMTRRQKAYRWIIDNQLASLMPAARPAPSQANYGYWEKYIDYVLQGSYVRSPQPPAPPAPPTTGGGGGGSTTTPTPPTTPTPTPPTPPIGFLPDSRVYADLGRHPLEALALLGVQEPMLRPLAAMALSSQVYGPAANGVGLPRVGGLYGRYNAYVPPSQDGDRIYRFNNPNNSAYPSAKSNLPKKLRNFFGYLTYVQFMMDHGRDLRPDGSTYVESSLESGRARMRAESVGSHTFNFPPRTQPMHASRRAIIAALDIVADRNGLIPGQGQRDHVALVSFDTTDGSVVQQELTHKYVDTMQATTQLQATGDKGTTTATETGLKLAQEILRPMSEGGQAREHSTKVLVLLTDGIPNAFESSEEDIDNFAASSAGGEFYGGGYYWLDAALMKTMQLEADKVNVFPVGVGLGTDYDFMDRMARSGGTADSSGQSPRGSGNPAEYEQRMIDIFEKIIKKPVAKLVF